MAAMSSAQIVSATALHPKMPMSGAGLGNNVAVTGPQSTRNSLQQVSRERLLPTGQPADWSLFVRVALDIHFTFSFWFSRILHCLLVLSLQ